MSKKDRIKELETELRLLDSIVYVNVHKSGLHARHNKTLLRYNEVLRELERISLKWKLKKFLRRFKKK